MDYSKVDDFLTATKCYQKIGEYIVFAEEAKEGATTWVEDETARHRVWWIVRDILDVKGSVLLEDKLSTSYVMACEDASVALGEFSIHPKLKVIKTKGEGSYFSTRAGERSYSMFISFIHQQYIQVNFFACFLHH